MVSRDVYIAANEGEDTAQSINSTRSVIPHSGYEGPTCHNARLKLYCRCDALHCSSVSVDGTKTLMPSYGCRMLQSPR